MVVAMVAATLWSVDGHVSRHPVRARLQKKEARYNQRIRKERNGQVVALGVLAEIIYKAGGQGAEVLKEAAPAHLKDKNLAQVLAAFSRLDDEAKPDGQVAPR